MKKSECGIEVRRVMIVMLILSCAVSLAQTSRRAFSLDQSRAEVAAEELVALSADTIMNLLRAEPGLLLEVKKILVRKAYEQGRLLHAKELDDEALFRLIQDDANIRILITHEIEDRNYISLKPSREELARAKSGRPSEPAKAAPNAAPTAPESKPSSVDVQRRLERVQLQAASDESSAGLPADVLSMPRLRPEELPGLLAATTNDTAIHLSGREAPKTTLPPPQPAPVADPSTDQQGVLVRQPNPYADVPALYDLYLQYSRQSGPLTRFGMDVFRNGTGNFADLPMDMPVGPEYVLGPGDGLSIDLWGSVSQRLQRVVDRRGLVSLPEAGVVQVAGRNLGDVQHMVQSVLRTQFRDVDADVSLSRLRTVRVYVVGDVERPGAYDISSLSTPLNAIYQAGGPTTRGSLRYLKHFRENKLVQKIDVYDLLLHGVGSDLEGLQPGDTILVSPLGPEITVEGMVRRPAIYELGPEKNLAEVLELAGGVLQSGTLRHIDVERVEAHLSRTMLRLDIAEDGRQESVTQTLESFQVQEGDKIRISPILPYANQTVYLAGHVFHPGKFPYRDGMKVTDLIRSYSEILPEPDKHHAEIVRLNPRDFMPTVLAFNLEDALAGQDRDPVLQPFDTVRIFSRFDFEDAPVITVNGQVRDPGDHLTNGATYLRDAIYLAGGATPDAQLNDAQVFRKTQDGKLKVISVNLSKALAGDGANNILLEAKDRVFVHKNQAKFDPATVKIEGEVERPGRYPLGEEMLASDLVRVAGGFKRGAYAEMADLTRYEVEDGKQVAGEHQSVAIGKAMAGEPDTDVRLHDGDVLTIRQVAGWNDIGATITITGEVLHPGTYGIRQGERLSSVLQRAGGFSPQAYPYGVIFERAQVKALEESNRTVLIREVLDDGTALKAVPETNPQDKEVKEASLLQWQRTMERLQNTPPSGRLVIHISKDVKRWANTSADLEVRAGDSMYVPKKPNIVLVDGSVYNPTAVTFKPGKSAGWYLRQAGGPTNMANKKAIFVIRADGSVVGGSGGIFSGSAEKTELRAGDMVVVPERAFAGTTKWKNTLQVAQLLQSVAFAVSLGRTF